MSAEPTSQTPMANGHGASNGTHLQDDDASGAAKKTPLVTKKNYECKFVEEPPKDLQTNCSMCQSVLLDPHLLTCCGYDVCRACVEQISRANDSGNKQCPLCNDPGLKHVPDVRCLRILKTKQVYCSYKENGCEWVGPLGDLSKHVNVDSGADIRGTGCPFALLDCDFCIEPVMRQDFKKHQAEECSQRAFSCSFCNEHHSTYENVTTKHWPICPSRPAPCPNKCGVHPKQQLLDAHLKKDCPLEITDCAFGFAGCTERMARKDIAAHISENLAAHVILQATTHQKQLEKISELEEQLKETTAEVSELKKKNASLKNETEQKLEYESKVTTVSKELRKEYDQQLAAYKKECESKIASIHQEMRKESERQLETYESMIKANVDVDVDGDKLKSMKKELTTLYKREISSLHHHIGLVPVTITMSDFDRKKNSGTDWSSYPFYTHSQGYKMVLRVLAKGFEGAQGSHVSVGLCLMQGEFDDYLKWPFRADVTVRLLNQERDEDHYDKKIRFQLPGSTARVTTSGPYAPKGEGISTFISHDDLVPRYLKNDCLQFCICNIRMLTRAMTM